MKIEEVYAKAKNKVEALKMTVDGYPKNKEAAAELEAEIIVLSALEKQIPKKVYKAGEYGISESCPRCKSEVKHAYCYCTVCGQALERE